MIIFSIWLYHLKILCDGLVTTIYSLDLLTDKQKNGQIVDQSSISWKGFCARDIDHVNEADSAFNLEN